MKRRDFLGSLLVLAGAAVLPRRAGGGKFDRCFVVQTRVGGVSTPSEFTRITVPMAFYSHTRRVTLASLLV